jgi:hypothetical protein
MAIPGRWCFLEVIVIGDMPEQELAENDTFLPGRQSSILNNRLSASSRP